LVVHIFSSNWVDKGLLAKTYLNWITLHYIYIYNLPAK